MLIYPLLKMADNEKVEESTPRGNEWEVVSLTASAYAAAPGPTEAELKDDYRSDTNVKDQAELTRTLFMSQHFVFPPSQHENLPLEPLTSEIQNETKGNVVNPEVHIEEIGGSSGKDERDWNIRDVGVHGEFPGIPIFDEKGNMITFHSSDFEEGTALEGHGMGDKEQNIYGDTAFESFHSETAHSGSVTYVGSATFTEEVKTPEKGFSSDVSESPKPAKTGIHDGSGLPCAVWWKRRAASLYAHAKDANTFWSIFVATAVMGLVILGQHWQQERWQVLLHKWQLSINSEVHLCPSIINYNWN